MNAIRHSAEGKKFVLTNTGKQIGRVAVKFDSTNKGYHKEYSYVVPESWINKGWVEEVSEEDEKCM